MMVYKSERCFKLIPALFILAALFLGSTVYSSPIAKPKNANLNAKQMAIGFDAVGTVIGKTLEILNAIEAHKDKTSIWVRGLLANDKFSGGTSLGVCYHGRGGGGCTRLKHDKGNPSQCWASGTTTTSKKSLGKGFVNNHIEIHANEYALCIDHLSFSYGTGDIHPHDEKFTITGDVTYECGHYWAYNTKQTGSYRHKCLFIGHQPWLQYKNTFTFEVDKLRTFRNSIASGITNNPSMGYNALMDVCKGISSWKRDDLPGTSPTCARLDDNWNAGPNMRRGRNSSMATTRIKISKEEHATNLKRNPNYIGNAPVNGYIDIGL